MRFRLTTDPFPDILPYKKTNSTGPAEYNSLRSAGPVGGNGWGKGSYHKDGRGECFGSPPGYDKQDTKK